MCDSFPGEGGGGGLWSLLLSFANLAQRPLPAFAHILPHPSQGKE
jgi:hypothetical protein